MTPWSTSPTGARRFAGGTAKWLTIINVGVTEGCEVEAGAGEEPVEETGPVLHPPEPGLDQGGQLGEVAFGHVGQGSSEV